MRIKDFVRDYLTFTRRDRWGVLALLLLILIVYLLPYLSQPAKENPLQPIARPVQQALETVQQQNPPQAPEENTAAYTYEPSRSAGFTGGELFRFDPNTLPAEGWQRLGLQERTIKTIVNYRTKGGRFYRPEDLQKIWGLPKGFYERVASYIQIEDKHKSTTTAEAFPKPENEERKTKTVAINTADTAALIALPGIGSKLAQRILNFRDKLGGFSSVEQIGETYGLPDSTFQKLKNRFIVDAGRIRKININTATKEELKSHPYIKWHVAGAIVEYRNQHGPFASLEELKKIVLVDEALFEKIAPYLILQ